MAPKKTLSSWLTSKYLLIIRNEENFAEKTTIGFNYARVLLILVAIGILVLSLSIYMVTVVLEKWIDPRYAQMEVNRSVLTLSMKVDSLAAEVESKDLYINNVRRLLAGDVIDEGLEVHSEIESSTSNFDKIQPIDSQFRAEFENSDLSNEIKSLSISNSPYESQSLYLFSPIDGIVTDGYDPGKDHYGVDLVAKENEPVRVVADGVVVLSSWTLDGGYVIAVQHSGNLISVYKHNSELFKNVGSFVVAGEVIAIIGNTGELTSGPHLHLELWHNGNPVNPQDYIAL